MSEEPKALIGGTWSTIQVAKVFVPTSVLRWKGRLPGERSLQQAWQDHWSGDVVWREVPSEP